MAIGTYNDDVHDEINEGIVSVVNRETKLLSLIPDENVRPLSDKYARWVLESGTSYTTVVTSDGATFQTPNYVGNTQAVLQTSLFETSVGEADVANASADPNLGGGTEVALSRGTGDLVKKLDRFAFRGATFSLLDTVVADSGVYADVNRSLAGNTAHRATIHHHGGVSTEITRAKLQTFVRATLTKNGTNNPSDYVMFCADEVWNKVAGVYQPTLNATQVQSGNFGSGVSSLIVEGIPVVCLDSVDGYLAAESVANTGSLWLINVKSPRDDLKIRYLPFKNSKATFASGFKYGIEVVEHPKTGHFSSYSVRNNFVIQSMNPGANGRLKEIKIN